MPRIHIRNQLARFGAGVGVPLLAGWLASGSCTIVACYEECDPCFQACKCSSNCQNPLAGEGGFRIVAADARVASDGEGRTWRRFSAIVGPELSCAEPAENCDEQRVAEFARRVLDVNASLFTAVREPVWLLDAVTPLGAGVAVQFHLAPVHLSGGASAPVHSLTLLLDPRGRLVEIDQVLDRGPR